MTGKIYKSCATGKLYFVTRTIPNLEKTRFFVEFYQISIRFQAIPSMNAGHYFPKRTNKNVTYCETIEDFQSSHYEPTEEEIEELKKQARLFR